MMLFQAVLRSFVISGSLRVIDSSGRSQAIGDGTGPQIVIRLTRPGLATRLAFNPKLSLGEAYADGGLVVEQGSLYVLMDLIVRNLGMIGPQHWLNWSGTLLPRWGNRIALPQAKRNVAHHYDLSPAFFDLFLDDDRQYSCAYFNAPDDTLEQAQTQKKAHIAAKLQLDRPGLRVLDIGSGWGGMAMFLAAQSSALVTGVTLSREQHHHSMARAEAAGLTDQVNFALQDYRQTEGVFDRIVSVGMFEHVGRRGYASYFAKMRDLLDNDGVALLHSIGDSGPPGPINPFITKYIFPGAEVPSLSEVVRAVELSGLFITDIEILQLHYAETLRHWRERLTSHHADVVRMYDERLFRTWEFYFTLCEVGFRYRGSMVFQMQLAKRKGRSAVRGPAVAAMMSQHQAAAH